MKNIQKIVTSIIYISLDLTFYIPSLQDADRFLILPTSPIGLDVNIIISVYEIIKKPLLKIFNDSLLLGIFPQSMKIAKVTPFYKSGKKNFNDKL